MAEVIWTNRALTDLEDIGDYISKDSYKYALNTIQKLFNSVEILKTMPKSGRIVPEVNKENIRELIKGNYRVIYMLREDGKIDILTVHHSARILNI